MYVTISLLVALSVIVLKKYVVTNLRRTDKHANVRRSLINNDHARHISDTPNKTEDRANLAQTRSTG